VARYSYRLLRYVSNTVSREFYNVAVVLYDHHGRIVDARFTPDFRRMRCNPVVNLSELEMIRDEFEDTRLLGEDFSGYIERLTEHGSNTIELSDAWAVDWYDPAKEIDRIVNVYLATGPGLEEDMAEQSPRLGGRRLVRLRMTEAFARQGLFRNGHGMRRDVGVAYGGSRLSFTFDFEYRRPTLEERFVHALGLRSAERDASQLCLVLDRYRSKSKTEAGLTVVAEDGLDDGVRDLLAESGVGTVNLSVIDGYAESIKAELGL
jgi:hypothetical protein